MKRKWARERLSVDILSFQGVVSSSILISTPGEDFLIDVGDGTLKLLKERQYRFERLHGIFLTHGHYDHMGGLWSFIGYLRFIKRKAEMKIYFPAGAMEIMEFVRVYHHLYSKTSPFDLVSKELKEGQTINLETLQMRPFAARHAGTISGKSEIMPCFGYVLICGDIKVVISGDTGPSRKLMEEVRGADYAIIEATFSDEEEVIPDTHLSISQASRIGRLAKEFCLVHLTDRSYPQALKEGLAPEEIK